MRNDEHALAGAHLRLDLLGEVRPCAGDGVLQALGQGHLVGRGVAVGGQKARVALVVFLQCGRAHIEAAAPDLHLVFAVLGGGFRLVQTLQGTVMALVQAPSLVHGQPFAVHCAQDVVQGVDGALQVRGVANVEIEAGLGQGAAAIGCFLAAGVGKVHIHPTGEEVQLVPFALAVANENELHGIAHGAIAFCSVCSWEGARCGVRG